MNEAKNTYLDARGIADKTGLGVRRVRSFLKESALMREGLWPQFRVGPRSLRVREKDVDGWMRRYQVG